MAQEILRQSAFNAGEWDPALKGRRDIKDYYRSLAGARNLVFQAQGPLLRRPGCAVVDFIRGPFETVTITADMFVAPNGGDPAQVIDRNEATQLVTTNDLAETDGYIVFRIDLGAVFQVHAVDLVDYGVVAGGGGAPAPAPPPVQYSFPYDPTRYITGGWQLVPL